MHRRAIAAALAVVLGAGLSSPLAATEKAWWFLAADLPGEAEDLGHASWIELTGFSVDGPLAAGQSAALGIAKGLDRASLGIFSACATGRVFDDVKIDLDAPIGDVALCRLELDSLIISQVTVTGGSEPSESVKLRYGAVTYTYYLPDTSMFVSVDIVAGQGGEGSGTGTDTDDDGMPDEWESTHGLDVGTTDAVGDLDGDGLGNRDEYLVGSHPSSGSSFFKVTAEPDAAEPGQLTLSWNTVPGRRYEILWSPDLATPFTPLAEITATAAATTHEVGMAGTLGFYRVRLVP